MKILTNKQLSVNIRALRHSSKLSQEQTVAKLQVLGSTLSRSTYSLIELGKGNIYVTDLVGLKNVFNADYSEFFIGITPKRDSQGKTKNLIVRSNTSVIDF